MDQPDEGPPVPASNSNFMVSTDPTELGLSATKLRSICVCHLLMNVDEEGNVNILKNGCWDPAGECIHCGDLSPTFFY
jgi:hypothetical protein